MIICVHGGTIRVSTDQLQKYPDCTWGDLEIKEMNEDQRTPRIRTSRDLFCHEIHPFIKIFFFNFNFGC